MKFAVTLPTVVFGAAIAALTSGCAGFDENTTEVKAPREYRTGTNIPVKDSAPPATPEERERTLEAIRAMQRTNPSGAPKP